MRLTLSYAFIFCLLFCACDNNPEEDMYPSTEMNLSSLIEEYTNSGFKIIDVIDTTQFHCDYTFDSYTEAMEFLSYWKNKNNTTPDNFSSRASFGSIPLTSYKLASGEYFFQFEYRMVEVTFRGNEFASNLTKNDFMIAISGAEIPYTTDTYKISTDFSYTSGFPNLYVYIAKIIHLNILGKFVEQIDKVENYYFIIQPGMDKVLVRNL